MIRRIFFWIVTTLLLSQISACNQPSNPIKKTSVNEAISESGHYIVQWELANKVIPYNDYFSIALTVKERLKPINYRVDIAVDAGMKEHNHGMSTRAIIKRTNKQSFIAEGMLFHMRGKWQVEVEIARGITRDKAIIEVLL